ncbi:MAG TPA: 30S ribosomal protein S16 [Candidatus Peribacteraceae bacterium]|nr:30S ribosomal protein S16 [Candidatus Peribacteraceae bacterium]
MLVIRLQRTGRKNLATYRIVAADKARPVKGKFLEILGHYLPARKDPVWQVNQERVTYWVSKGAIPSDTVARLLKKNGVKDMEKFIQRYTKQRSKKAPPEESAAPAAAAAAPVADLSAEASAKAEAAPAEEAAPAGDNA